MCNDNRLISIEGLSALTSLRLLRCYNNDLQGELIGLSRLCRLECFNCGGNKLTSLDGLSQSVTRLDCRRNNLSWLPDLSPQLTSIATMENVMIPSCLQCPYTEDLDYIHILLQRAHEAKCAVSVCRRQLLSWASPNGGVVSRIVCI